MTARTDMQQSADQRPRHPSQRILPFLGSPAVGGRRVGGGVMGAPQVVDSPPSQATGRERILPDMRYLGGPPMKLMGSGNRGCEMRSKWCVDTRWAAEVSESALDVVNRLASLIG